MTNRHVSLLAYAAVRYALGRQSYIVSDVAAAVEAVRERLTPDDRAVILADIDRAESERGLGMDCDAAAWRGLRAVLWG